ncbi:HS12A-like protein [Mya arenaria]|uniref:HS12A-like protein n=1 Tax=Mya arenaria TaxID=6604 RepID=A0ABY7DSP4_MYAAR|nr:HS12A-like protein [Mya arenaria]
MERSVGGYPMKISGKITNEEVSNKRSDGDVSGKRSDGEVSGKRSDGEVSRKRSDEELSNKRSDGDVSGKRSDGEVRWKRSDKKVVSGKGSDGEVSGKRSDGEVSGMRADGEVSWKRSDGKVSGKGSDGEVCGKRSDGDVSGKRSNGEVSGKRSDGEISGKRSALYCAAIDIGTKYTGYAFSSRDNHKKVLTMTSDMGSPKVPTVVLFDQNKKFNSFGYEAESKYKELLSQDNHREWYLFKEFKMTLFQTKELKENTPVKDFQERKQMPAIDIFSNAIRFIKDKLLEDLKKKGSGIRDRDIHWVLTVPAIWNDAAKQFMRNAATKVTLTDFQAGGTADMTCQQVVDGGLKELKRPNGGNLGGTNVDKSFIKLLVDIFGLTVVGAFRKKHLNEFWDMMMDFEFSKRKFDGTGQLTVKFPALLREIYEKQETNNSIDYALKRAERTEDIQIKRDKMHISKEKGQQIFDETIDRIIEETQILLKALEMLGNVDYIVLVGGFSESKYFQTKMKEKFGDKVVAPAEPRTAVMRGAVLCGHNPAAIQTRVSKYTYGIATMKHFKRGIHPEEKRIVLDGKVYCDDIFEKHVTIGHEIKVDQTMKEITYYPIIDDQAHAALQVFVSSKDNPKYVTDEGCRQVGLLLVNMDTGGNRNFEIKVKLICGGTEIQVEVRDGHGILIKEARMDFLV